MEYPCQIGNFREEVQAVFSLLSQILGMDHDREVSNVMLSFLVIYHEAEKSKSANTVAFDQFLGESMHGKFVNF